MHWRTKRKLRIDGQSGDDRGRFLRMICHSAWPYPNNMVCFMFNITYNNIIKHRVRRHYITFLSTKLPSPRWYLRMSIFSASVAHKNTPLDVMPRTRVVHADASGTGHVFSVVPGRTNTTHQCILTHWPREPHIGVNFFVIIGPRNGLAPSQFLNQCFFTKSIVGCFLCPILFPLDMNS